MGGRSGAYKPDPEVERQRREAERQAAEEKARQQAERRQDRVATRQGLRGFRGLLSVAGEMGFQRKTRVGP